MALYKGFSTYNRRRKFGVTDFDLIKQDLFNHLHIRKGEKLMNPEFGTIIWGVLFEPFTNELRDAILEDIKRIVKYDPRVALEQLSLSQYEHGLQLDMTLNYISENVSETISLQFDRHSDTITQGRLELG